jgi:hypothetical protein
MILTQPRMAMRYPLKTIQRAERAMRCAPFQLKLFVQMYHCSVALLEIAGPSGVHQHYTLQALPELIAESDLLWLIQVGLLRREVDGQGLTDSFRLTPLGRQLVEKWQMECTSPPYSAGWRDRLWNSLSRWLRLPL